MIGVALGNMVRDGRGGGNMMWLTARKLPRRGLLWMRRCRYLTADL